VAAEPEGDKAIRPTPLYLRAGLKLSQATGRGDAAFEEYVSDPPSLSRSAPGRSSRWAMAREYVVALAGDDQREASGRPDRGGVRLRRADCTMRISGEPIANLIASTSGTDSDGCQADRRVPDEVAGDAVMGGYQLMVAADIFAARYRESFETAKPLTANTPLSYKFALPTANHVFLPGHRIMVQVQSSLVPACTTAIRRRSCRASSGEAGGLRKATQRVLHAPDRSSFVETPPRNASMSRTNNRN